MPFHRVQNYPYGSYHDEYTPSETVQRAPYASESPRTLEEMDEAYYRATAWKRGNDERLQREAQERANRPRWIPPHLRR